VVAMSIKLTAKAVSFMYKLGFVGMLLFIVGAIRESPIFYFIVKGFYQL
jgi:hypothetical protein